MTAPTVTVEVAFTSSFSTPEGSRVWTDVTAYVDTDQVAVAIGFGRTDTDERTQADANSLTLTVDNRDGRFTPEKASGAYYPNVRIYRPIRITAQYSGGTARRRFTGYVRSWKPGWSGGSDAMAQVTISGASRMQRLGMADPLRSVVEETVLANGPAAYFTMGDPEGSVSASDSSGKNGPALKSTGDGTAVTFGVAGLSIAGSATAAQFSAGKYLSATIQAFGAVGPFITGCIGAWVRVTAAGGNVFEAGDLTLSAAGVLTAGGTPITLNAPALADGGLHYVGVEYAYNIGSSAFTLKLYLDGVLADSASGAGSGNISGGSALVVGRGLAGTIAHFGIFYVPFIGESDLYAAGASGFAGETTADRADRYLGWRGVPAAEVDAVDTTRTVQHFDTAGTSLLDNLRILESTEAGVLYDGQDGHTRLVGETSRYTATSAFTLNLSEQYVTTDFDPDYDDTQVLNDVTVESVDGSSARAVKQSSIDDYGRVADTLKTAANTDAAAPDDAAWAIARCAEPATRLSSVMVTVHSITDTVLREAILAASVGTLLTITSLPSQFPSSSGTWFVEGYSESFGVGTHYITFNLSPSAAYLSAFLLDSATRGVLDTSTLGH